MSRPVPAAVRQAQQHAARQVAARRNVLALVHWQTLDALSHPTATPQDVLDWAEAAMLWSKVAELGGLTALGEALAPHLHHAADMTTRLAEHPEGPHQVADPTELHALAAAARVMDQLATVSTATTQHAAACWNLAYRQQLDREMAAQAVGAQAV